MAKKAKDLIAHKSGSSAHKRKTKPKMKGELTLIVCEGTTTEIHYFKDMVHALKLSSAQVKVCHGKHSNPESVLDKAIDIYNEEKKYEKIYVVVDVDEHSNNLQQAKIKLKAHRFANRIKDGSKIRKPIAQIIVSKPCIELWFILHFELLQKTFSKTTNSISINCKNHLRDN
ncbi:MAG: hypothetical protein ACI8WB_000775, partial [Phenylobacterium sp.]